MRTPETIPNSSSQELNNLLAFLRGLAEGRFWGSLTVKFEAGRPTYVKEERTLRVEDLPPNESRHANATAIK